MLHSVTNLKCSLGEIKKSNNVLHYVSTQIHQCFSSNLHQFIWRYFPRGKVNSLTAWKVSKYGDFSGPYFCLFGTERTPYFDTYHTVPMSPMLITNTCVKITFPFRFITSVACIDTFFCVIYCIKINACIFYFCIALNLFVLSCCWRYLWTLLY